MTQRLGNIFVKMPNKIQFIPSSAMRDMCNNDDALLEKGGDVCGYDTTPIEFDMSPKKPITDNERKQIDAIIDFVRS